MKIAVIGAGSSGLVTLKYLLDTFPSNDIFCFEKSHSVRGCWGDQRPDFISTSTKYTTQFSCFRKWTSNVSLDKNHGEFFRGAEFGDYLEKFASHFKLHEFIQFGIELRHIERSNDNWRLLFSENGKENYRIFDAVFLCTGLVNQKVPFGSTAVPIAEDPENVRNATVVVVGGGESAADVANHLAKPEHNNKVYLSLRSGIRVSPRYHPIRGVPSDFLRNRLLLSFDKRLRNWVGERFVTFRIRYTRLLARWFPHRGSNSDPDHQAESRRREWDLKLKARAGDELFNVFHNKSDDFLDAVAANRLHIIGPPTNDQWDEYFDFDRTTTLRVSPDLLAWSAGYRSHLTDLSAGAIQLKDFYLGCVHTDKPNLFLIGFARPIIGNIPTISEMQARYAIGVLSGKIKLPSELEKKQKYDWQTLSEEYRTIDVNNVYPVEQYPYCDLLAKEMGIMPTFANVRQFTTWLKLYLVPASTTHYVDEYFNKQAFRIEKIYMPIILYFFLSLMRILGYPLRLINPIRKGKNENFKPSSS
ncbi:MAG TPA: hypothetical protein DCX53_12650 [Anaerolineae bacterium]|nr:hypothetical protein [Anaerolineae bacterium]